MSDTTTKPLKIDLQHCVSSAIAAHGYDPATQTLALKFTGGGVYHYPDVSVDQYDALLRAKSVGRWYAESIKGKHEGAEQPHYREPQA